MGLATYLFWNPIPHLIRYTESNPTSNNVVGGPIAGTRYNRSTTISTTDLNEQTKKQLHEENTRESKMGSLIEGAKEALSDGMDVIKRTSKNKQEDYYADIIQDSDEDEEDVYETDTTTENENIINNYISEKEAQAVTVVRHQDAERQTQGGVIPMQGQRQTVTVTVGTPVPGTTIANQPGTKSVDDQNMDLNEDHQNVAQLQNLLNNFKPNETKYGTTSNGARKS